MFRIFFSGRLSDKASEFMHRPRNVNDWLGTRMDFSQFMVNPSQCRRSNVSNVLPLESSTEEPRIKKSSR